MKEHFKKGDVIKIIDNELNQAEPLSYMGIDYKIGDTFKVQWSIGARVVILANTHQGYNTYINAYYKRFKLLKDIP